MKTITRVVAVLMMIAVFAALMTACNKSAGSTEAKNHIDQNLIGTWKQTDDKEGNWTWTFKEDGTCTLDSDTNDFAGKGTYIIEEENIGKIKITLDKWDKEQLFTYTATDKVLNLQNFDVTYYCQKQ